MQSSSALIAILPFAGVLVGAALQYFFGRSLESQKQLAIKKGDAYADYFKAVAVLATKGPSNDARNLAAEAKTRICIYGSALVLQCLHDFERSGAKAVTPEGQVALVRLVSAMRKDLRAPAGATKESDLQAILFGLGVPTIKVP